MAILVTGGAGYIGSHTVVELQNAGYDVVVVDNLCNSSEKALDRVSKITGKPVKFYKADILDRDAMNEVFDKEEIDSCIHFAGPKAALQPGHHAPGRPHPGPCVRLRGWRIQGRAPRQRGRTDREQVSAAGPA